MNNVAQRLQTTGAPHWGTTLLSAKIDAFRSAKPPLAIMIGSIFRTCVKRRLGPLPIALTALVTGALAQSEEPREKQRLSLDVALSERAILSGYRRYHGTCSHCHGPDGSGSTIAPSLIEELLPYPEFEAIVRQGSESGTFVMLGFADDPNVDPYIDDIYAYLSARADGTIGRGRPTLKP